MTCDVVPLDVCQVVLGSPYLWDRDATLHRRKQNYTFTKDGESLVIRPIYSPLEGASLITATQSKRLVNASIKFILLVIRSLEEKPSRVFFLPSLYTQQEDDLERLKLKYKELFLDVTGLPPKRGVEHAIMLSGERYLLNVGFYRTSIEESDEIKRQVQELLELGMIVPSASSCGSAMLLVPKKDKG
ncbi:uncharacterized protein LOC113352638 [Papaver somniferum]|uniref:uncharacterized protein LOC113352638 n=1 Tax=Papaver somniferum TaxID=3469 RepID=UPI000E6FE9C7|nr:uncharacterized protein LOC113352638 [Papaver somniferum]